MGTRADRLLKEFEDMQINPPPMCSAGPKANGDLEVWTAIIQGPDAGPYADFEFEVEIAFPALYPTSPPRAKFITKMYHPNICTEGSICTTILKSEWNAKISVGMILVSIQALLDDPNPNSVLNSEAGTLFKKDREEYDKFVNDFCNKHAKAL